MTFPVASTNTLPLVREYVSRLAELDRLRSANVPPAVDCRLPSIKISALERNRMSPLGRCHLTIDVGVTTRHHVDRTSTTRGYLGIKRDGVGRSQRDVDQVPLRMRASPLAPPSSVAMTSLPARTLAVTHRLYR